MLRKIFSFLMLAFAAYMLNADSDPNLTPLEYYEPVVTADGAIPTKQLMIEIVRLRGKYF